MGVAQQETFRVLGFLEHLGWVAPATRWIDWITLPMWGIVLQPLAFFMFLTALMAENKRAPFDTPEGESEIVAGYFIEYCGMKFGPVHDGRVDRGRRDLGLLAAHVPRRLVAAVAVRRALIDLPSALAVRREHRAT